MSISEVVFHVTIDLWLNIIYRLIGTSILAENSVHYYNYYSSSGVNFKLIESPLTALADIDTRLKG